MARKPGGYLQALLSTVGFLLVMFFLILFCYGLAHQMLEGANSPSFSTEWHHYSWAGIWGVVLCALSWAWALLSSLQMLRESRP